jgi:hypothetical protein
MFVLIYFFIVLKNTKFAVGNIFEQLPGDFKPTPLADTTSAHCLV